MDYKDFIAIAGVVAVIVGPIVTWWVMRKQYASKKITYDYSIDSIVKNDDVELARDLKVSYQGIDIKNPALLSLNIANSGLTAIENVEIMVHLPGAAYLIPAYFVKVPPGYETLWKIQKIDEENCKIYFEHINPKQIAEIRLLMDENKETQLIVSCPMPNVIFVRNKMLFTPELLDIILHILDSRLIYPFKLR